MAKELSMVERTAPGRVARQYFIECEKKLHGQQEIKKDQYDLLEQEARILKMSGFSDGVVQASLIERDDAHYNTTGSHLLPLAVREDCRLRAGNLLTWDRGVEVTTRSAAAVALPHFVIHTVTEIAQGYNRKRVTPTVINNALTDAGYQVKLARATYTKTALSEDYAQTRIRANGPFKGLPIITGWKMAKELSMVERTDVGKIARQYA